MDKVADDILDLTLISVTNSNKLLAKQLTNSVEVVDGAVKPNGHVAGTKDPLRVAETLVQEEQVMATSLLHPCGCFKVTTVVGEDHNEGEKVHC